MNYILSMTSVFLTGLLLATSAFSAQFDETFGGTLPSPSWTTRIDPGYAIQLVNGRANFSKVGPNSSNSAAFMRTSFAFDGDFSVSVDLDARTGSSLYEGFTVEWANSTAFAQLYLIDGRIFQGAGPSPTNFGSNWSSTNTAELKFKISRVGSTMSLSFDRGLGGYETYYTVTGPTYSGPVYARMEVNTTGSSAASTSYYDNFTVQAGTITPVPEPATVALFLAGLVLLAQYIKRAQYFAAK